MAAGSDAMSTRTSSDSTATEEFPPAPALVPQLRPTVPGASSTASAPTVVVPSQYPRSQSRVHNGITINTGAVPQSAPHLPPTSPVTGLRRRSTRATTFRTIEELDEYEYERGGGRFGAEPGLDPTKVDGGQDTVPTLHADCQVTVVDFSQDHLQVHELDNSQLVDFVMRPQPSWVKCRWINVNGISWDVIQALGKYKNLHRLAIEDVMNPRNRTKADWYAGHTFLVLTCMKLVRLIDDDTHGEADGDDGDRSPVKSRSGAILHGAAKKVRRWITGKKAPYPKAASALEKGTSSAPPPPRHLSHKATGLSDVFNPNTVCTLQRYHAAPNAARTEYMEKHSALASKGLAVMAEQVAMFITSDNTVIAFFEQSADDVEEPILARLQSATTILRQSCDASMVAQAIIDAIIDMAIPVTACYADIIGDLELDVLTHPNIRHTKNLYIIIAEINKMFSFVNPIQALINTLRDHKTKLAPESVSRELQNPLGGVIITPMTYTYLGDVYDHCVLITENLTQIKESANHMIDLIFNTIATYQNESMKQLTIVTIIFLPLTFITGYFGQNFGHFPEASDNSSRYFWAIALPVVVATVLLLMRDVIFQSVDRFITRRRILSIRKRKKRRMSRTKTEIL
ncbi:hypothetical protein GGR57DRAFT_15282 [Xylariaceae sp. FL1272]|nr:hypothetical protein GGR57DRAFT_15282 [Xylariaceae sp. FL1272]